MTPSSNCVGQIESVLLKGLCCSLSLANVHVICLSRVCNFTFISMTVDGLWVLRKAFHLYGGTSKTLTLVDKTLNISNFTLVTEMTRIDNKELLELFFLLKKLENFLRNELRRLCLQEIGSHGQNLDELKSSSIVLFGKIPLMEKSMTHYYYNFALRLFID